MPINSIISQPDTNSISVAYRPIIFIVDATQTGGGNRPPVVYCDIYLNGIFYKTLSKTQYQTINDNSSSWQFDIQDACQESLTFFLPINGAQNILTSTGTVLNVQCKFRSSGIDVNGFITPEPTAPIQGTGRVQPIAGTGFASNSFVVINATLQHIQNQDLSTHLSYYKYMSWTLNNWPVTHRRDNHKICKQDSDYYPILSLDNSPDCINIYFRYKGDTEYTKLSNCGVVQCNEVSFLSSQVLPNANANKPYSFSITLGGSAPFVLTNIVKPSWLTISISGEKVVFLGTPTTAATGVAIKFNVTNCGGENTISLNRTINVISCIALSYPSQQLLPDAQIGQVYSQDRTINGDLPITMNIISKPAWMTISITNNTFHFGGTPDSRGTNFPITVKFSNCGGSYTFNDTIDVIRPDGEAYYTSTDFIDGNASVDEERANITNAIPGATVQVVLDISSFVNTNGGQILFNGVAAYAGEFWDLVADANGNVSFNAKIIGDSNNQHTAIYCKFIITAVSSGTISAPPQNAFIISKAF